MIETIPPTVLCPDYEDNIPTLPYIVLGPESKRLIDEYLGHSAERSGSFYEDIRERNVK